MSHLLREHAPLTESDWGLIDEEARSRLKVALAARQLVDFAGPKGWSYSAASLGRVTALAGNLVDGVTGAQRRVLPVVELRADFAISREELRAAARGAEDADLEALDEAALNIALAENIAVFHGWEEAGIVGIAEASSNESIPLGEESLDPARIADAPILDPSFCKVSRLGSGHNVSTFCDRSFSEYSPIWSPFRVQRCGRAIRGTEMR